MEEIKKLVVIDGSPRSKEVSNTYKALTSEIKFYKEKNPNMEVKYIKLPANLQGCVNCPKCKAYCNIKDEMQDIIKEIETASHVLIGSPVYLDMPTPQIVAFLTRLNCMAENTGREFFRNKKVMLTSVSFCSGTKTVIHMLMGACEMLGFTIEGRSTREYIALWKDEKLRGGMNRSDAIYLE